MDAKSVHVKNLDFQESIFCWWISADKSFAGMLWSERAKNYEKLRNKTVNNKKKRNVHCSGTRIGQKKANDWNSKILHAHNILHHFNADRTFGAFQSKNALILSSSLKLILLRFFSCSFASHYLATCLNAILCVKLPLWYLLCILSLSH